MSIARLDRRYAQSGCPFSPRHSVSQAINISKQLAKVAGTHLYVRAGFGEFAARPVLAGYDWIPPSNVEKLMYKWCVLQISATTLASGPRLLGTSVACKIGPRSEFMYCSRPVSPDVPVGLLGCPRYLYKCSDSVFAAKFGGSSANSPVRYDETYRQQWL